MPQGVGSSAKSSVKHDESLITFWGWAVTLLWGWRWEGSGGVSRCYWCLCSTWDTFKLHSMKQKNQRLKVTLAMPSIKVLTKALLFPREEVFIYPFFLNHWLLWWGQNSSCARKAKIIKSNRMSNETHSFPRDPVFITHCFNVLGRTCAKHWVWLEVLWVGGKRAPTTLAMNVSYRKLSQWIFHVQKCQEESSRVAHGLSL